MAIEFEVEDRRIDPATHVVSVKGEVDLFTAPEFKQRVMAPIAAGTQHVVVDLTSTTFIDSSSLGVLIGAQRHAPSSPASGGSNPRARSPRTSRPSLP